MDDVARRMLEAICAEPGLHPRDYVRRTRVGYTEGTTAARQLIAAGLVRRTGQTCRCGTGPWSQPDLGIPRSSRNHRCARHLLRRPRLVILVDRWIFISRSGEDTLPRRTTALQVETDHAIGNPYRKADVTAQICKGGGSGRIARVNQRGRLVTIVTIFALATACSSAPASTAVPTTASTSAGATSDEPGTMPELTATYGSAWYGYSVGYPSGWTTTDGTGPWPPGKVLRHGDPRLDVIEGQVASGGDARFVGASQTVAAGTSLRQFAAVENPFTCAPGDRLPKELAIDSASALVTLDGCPSEAELGGLIWDVVVISGGRGYDFTIDGDVSVSDASDWLSSIRLDPASARTG